MPEMEQWWCEECKAPFSDMTVKPMAICPECKSRCFTLARKAVIEKPVESKPETVVS